MIVMASQEAHEEIVKPKSELKVDSIRARMTSMVTYYMAAQIIAKPDFPQKDGLPPLCPPPFNNFGHQLLMDYKLLSSIIWEVIENIKSSIRVKQGAKLPWILASVITAGGFLLLGIVSHVILIIIAFIIPLIIYGIGAHRVTTALRKEVADIRARAIEQLINGEWKSTNSSLSGIIEDEIKKPGRRW